MAAASIISSIVTAGSNNHATISEEANAYATDFVSQGVVGAVGNTSGAGPATGGFGLSQDASPDMGVLVNLGVAYVLGTPSGQGSQVMRARMTTNYTTYIINANASGSTKYDWIYLQLSATNAATPSAAADNVITLLTSRSTSNVSDNGTPPTYGLLLGVVTVTNGASSIVNANISDRRVQSAISNSTTTSTTGWQSLNAALTYSANNGNKEFVVTAPTDLTSTLSAGMKLRIPRGVTPPTQCMAFTAASSQYALKSSPSGITFTSAFTVEGWIYLNSYTGNVQEIMMRENGTSGWGLYVSASGQLNIYYGASSSFTNAATSYQSIPLRQWTHVAGVVSSVSGKTGVVYINGTLVSSSSSGTATTLVQPASNLQLAAYNTPANTYFDGFMSEMRLWSAAQTQASIQANMAINLVGNETNLVALYQGNGVFTDATTNANNLTQSGGAIATQVANPYSTNEYAAIAKVTYSNPTSTIILHTGDTSTIPNQTLGTVAYSNSGQPFSLPDDLALTNRRLLYVPVNASQATTSTSRAQFNPITNLGFTIPSNCRKIFIKAYNPAAAEGSGITVYEWFNGTLTQANSVGQYNVFTGNAGLSVTIPVGVTPGSTFSLNMSFLVTAGTANWGASPGGSIEQAVWVEQG